MTSTARSLPVFADVQQGPFSPAVFGYAFVVQAYRSAAGPASFAVQVFDQARIDERAKAMGLIVDWNAPNGLTDALQEAVILKRWWETARPLAGCSEGKTGAQ